MFCCPSPLSAALTLQALIGTDGEKCRARKLAGMTHGIALLLILFTGFGMIAKLGLGFPLWVWVKLVVIWLVIGASTRPHSPPATIRQDLSGCALPAARRLRRLPGHLQTLLGEKIERQDRGDFSGQSTGKIAFDEAAKRKDPELSRTSIHPGRRALVAVLNVMANGRRHRDSR